MNLARTQVLKLAGSSLGDFHVGNQGKDYVGRIPLLEMGFDPQGICSVHEDTCVLGRYDGFDNRGQIVDIGKRLDAEDYIVVGIFAR